LRSQARREAFQQVLDRRGAGRAAVPAGKRQAGGRALARLAVTGVQPDGDDRLRQVQALEAQREQAAPGFEATSALAASDLEDRRLRAQVEKTEARRAHRELVPEEKALELPEQPPAGGEQKVPVVDLAGKLAFPGEPRRLAMTRARLRQAAERTVELEERSRTEALHESLPRQAQAVADAGDAHAGERLERGLRPGDAGKRHGCEGAGQVLRLLDAS